jgi:hypothetical protein
MSHRTNALAIAAALVLAVAALGAHAEDLTLTVGTSAELPVFTDQPRPVITGSTNAPAGSAVTVTIEGQAQTTTVGSDGRFSLSWPADLEAGSHLVSATVTAADGRTVTVEQDLRVDLEAFMPRQAIEQPPTEPPLPRIVPNIDDFAAYTDRWQIVPPADYELQVSPKGKWDPYNQNILKGDKPRFGKDVFLALTGISDTLVEVRDLPTPTGVSTNDPTSFPFFGDGEQLVMNQNVVVTGDLYKGLTTFRPATWRARATLVGNVNYVALREANGVNVDVREGTDRTDGAFAVQELFYEHKLKTLSENFDFMSVRAGVQSFVSDFRGFIFNDQNLGVRLFGNWDNNRYQYNVAYFDRLEKDTNSGLNKYELRDQQVFVMNAYRQDTFVKGYTTQVSFHYMHDGGGVYYDKNGGLVRPAPVGDFVPHEIDAYYLGWSGLGKIGVWNVDHAFYYVTGKDSRDPIAGSDPLGGGVGNDGVQPGGGKVDISAYMGFVEVSRDYDWIRPRAAIFFASGDDDIFDRDAKGFDAIFSNPNALGGGFSFWNRMGIRLPGTGLGLTQRGSLLADLQSSKDEGQPEYVNPGVQIASVGVDFDVTPRLKALFTTNYIRLATTEVIEGLIFQDNIDREMGYDVNLGVRYRPFNSNNVTVLGGAAAFVPGAGWKDIYEDDSLHWHFFTNLTLQF